MRLPGAESERLRRSRTAQEPGRDPVPGRRPREPPAGHVTPHRSRALARAGRKERQPPSLAGTTVGNGHKRSRARIAASAERPEDATPRHPRIGAGAPRRRRGVAHDARRLIERRAAGRGVAPRLRLGARRLFLVPPPRRAASRSGAWVEGEHGPSMTGHQSRRSIRPSRWYQ